MLQVLRLAVVGREHRRKGLATALVEVVRWSDRYARPERTRMGEIQSWNDPLESVMAMRRVGE